MGGLLGDVRDLINDVQNTLDRNLAASPDNPVNTRHFLKRSLDKWARNDQLRIVGMSTRGKNFLMKRRQWYSDPLLLSISHPQMRHLRSLRLGVSDLSLHCYRRKSTQPICTFCSKESEST